MEKAVVKTDIQIALPAGCYGRVGKQTGYKKSYELIPEGFGVTFTFRCCFQNYSIYIHMPVWFIKPHARELYPAYSFRGDVIIDYFPAVL